MVVLPRPSVLLALTAVPLAALFPPTAHPSVAPLLPLLLAPCFLLLLREPARGGAWLLLLSVGASTLSFLFASYRHAAVGVFVAALLYAAAWVGGRRMGREGLHGLGFTLAATGGLLAAHGLWQVLFGLERAARAAREAGADPVVMVRLTAGRGFARFPLPSQLGVFLLLALGATAWLWSRQRRVGPPGLRWALAALLLLQVAGLAATFSLGVFLAGGLALLWLAWLELRRASRRGLGVALAGLLVVLILAAGLALVSRPDLAGLDAPHHPVRLRLANWKVAGEMWWDHPLVGVGPGSFGVRYPGYMRAGMNETRYAHSLPLQLLAEAGTWILLPLGLAALALVRLARDHVEGSRRFLAAAVLAFAVANLWDFHLYLPALGVPFFLLAGGLTGPPRREEAPRIWSRATAALGLLLLLGVGLHAGLVRMQERAVLDALVEGRPEEARAGSLAWSRLSPLDANPPALASHFAEAEGDLRAATRLAWEAGRRDPWTPFRHARLSELLAAGDDLSGALHEADRAVELYPLQERYRLRREALRARIEDGSRGAGDASP